MEPTDLILLANHSGGVLYVLIGLLTITLVVIVERSWVLRHVTRQGEFLIRQLAALANHDRNGLAQVLNQHQHALQSPLLDVLLACPPASEEWLTRRLDELVLRIVPLLDRRLWVLDTSVTLAPLLGLLGTIIGMFHAFHVLAAPGTAPSAITAGVAEALIATAGGLLIAVIGLVFFNGLNERVRLAAHQLETVKVMLINRFAEPAAEERLAPRPKAIRGGA